MPLSFSITAAKVFRRLARSGSVVLSLAFILMLILSTSCSKPKDVTNDSNFGNFKSVVGTWKTKIPLRLVAINKKLYLVTNFESYSQEHELLVVPKGAEIRIEKLMFEQAFETNYLDVMGYIVAGEYSGKSVNIDGRLFNRIKEGTPTDYYTFKYHQSDPKPDWVVAPDKLERVSTN